MKLIYCPICGDVRRLTAYKRECVCGASWGLYHDDRIHATVGGKAIPLGFDNLSFRDALAHRPPDGLGATFTAFVIPEKCEHIHADTITDGEATWSATCPKCGGQTMQIVRPGKVQCSRCS